MRYIFTLAFILITSPAVAGICVNHDGEKVQSIQKGSSSVRCGGDYYTNESERWDDFEGLDGVPNKFLKISEGFPVEMSQGEKDAVLQAEATAQQQAEDAAWNAKIDRVKEDIDNPSTEYGLMMEVVTDIIQVEIQAIKDGTPNPKAEKSTLKAVAKQKLDALKK